MKKKNLNTKLSFTKSTVSNFKATQVKGGTGDTREVDCDTSQVFQCLSVANCLTANCTVNCTAGCPTDNCPTNVSCQPSCFNAMCDISNQQGPC
ncbi:hypothetical protein [Kordia sp.]|uniref:hypothetical protein n=1 Tax=Kordia sp. TaxID=1965332 RepID=UPI003B5A2DDB